MKKNTLYFTLLVFLIASPAMAQTQPPMPETIRDFYQNLNLINAYSTPSERSFLKECSSIDQVPNDGTGRLKKVYQAMKFVDNKMGSSPEYMPRMRVNGTRNFATGLYQVVKYEASEGSVKVWVKVFQMDSESPYRFIADYKKARKFQPLSGDALANLANVTSRTEQANEWSLTANGWEKSNVDMILVR